MNYWLMKTEPDVFGILDLKRDQKTPWEGVRNYQARNYMRDEMQVGDLVLFYHSSCKTPGVAGLAEVISKPYPDPSQFDPQSDYFDAKSNLENPRWYLVDVGFKKQFVEVFSLQAMKKCSELSEMKLLQKGNRLSIMPVSKREFDFILNRVGS